MTSDGSDADGLGGKDGLHLRAGDQSVSEAAPTDLIEVAGAIKWFDVAKGYGFIVPDGGGSDILLHVTTLRRDGFQTAQDRKSVV